MVNGSCRVQAGCGSCHPSDCADIVPGKEPAGDRAGGKKASGVAEAMHGSDLPPDAVRRTPFDAAPAARALRILVAPSGFKEGLSAERVCAAIAAGVRSVCPAAEIDCLPVPDGGEGFADSLARATGGTLRHVTVTGPPGEPSSEERRVGKAGGRKCRSRG